MLPVNDVKLAAPDAMDKETSHSEKNYYTRGHATLDNNSSSNNRRTEPHSRKPDINAGCIKLEYLGQCIHVKTEHTDDNGSTCTSVNYESSLAISTTDKAVNLVNRRDIKHELQTEQQFDESTEQDTTVFGDKLNVSTSVDKMLELENAIRVINKLDDDTENIVCTSDEGSDNEEATFDENNNEAEELDLEQKATIKIAELVQVDEVNGSDGVTEVEKGAHCLKQDNKNSTKPTVTQYPTIGPLNKQAYRCHICLKEFMWNSSLTRHLNRRRCTKKTTEQFDVNEQAHNIDVDSTRPLCKLCGESFSTKYTLKMHMKLHDPVKADKTKSYMSCDVCHKLFTNESNLTLHMEVHTGTQKHACSYCDVLFSRKTDLQRHEMIHTGERPYKCSKCDKRFRLPGDLGRHRKMHTGEQTCKHCGKSYARMDEFRRHVAKHVANGDIKRDVNVENKSAFFCTICPTFFTSDLNLQNHMLLHERCINKNLFQSKMYLCNHCGIEFSTSSNLYRHTRRVHSSTSTFVSEPPVNCDLCSKVFKTKEALKTHIRATHLNQKRYPCAHCSCGFEKRRDFKRHMALRHPQEETST